jgi:hypothetical protein
MATQAQTSFVKAELDELMQIRPESFSPAQRYELENLFNHCTAGAETSSQKLVASLIIKAFNRRIRSESISNHIYLNKSETPQIELFRILIEKFPFVKHSQAMVNRRILDAIGTHSEITLIDIGIGQGIQVLRLLQDAANITTLSKVRVIGIEPFADALEDSRQRIEAFAETSSINITFEGICAFAEDFDFSILAGGQTPVIVNASLALHHIRTQEDREKTLKGIRSLNPAALLLIEPNSDHFQDEYFRRYQSCYNHYYNLFCVIDQLEIAEEDKNTLKLFFGREINDVLGNEDAQRFEKHEPAIGWLDKLHRTGFNICSDTMALPPSGEYGVEIRQHEEGFVGFTFGNETILAVICASA